jgi:hypothetical protein
MLYVLIPCNLEPPRLQMVKMQYSISMIPPTHKKRNEQYEHQETRIGADEEGREENEPNLTGDWVLVLDFSTASPSPTFLPPPPPPSLRRFLSLSRPRRLHHSLLIWARRDDRERSPESSRTLTPALSGSHVTDSPPPPPPRSPPPHSLSTTRNEQTEKKPTIQSPHIAAQLG